MLDDKELIVDKVVLINKETYSKECWLINYLSLCYTGSLSKVFFLFNQNQNPKTREYMYVGVGLMED